MTDSNWDLAHEVWAAAQRTPNEAILDCVSRIEEIISQAIFADREDTRNATLDESIAALQPLYLDALKRRLPGDDLDDNEVHFNIDQCAQALGITRSQLVIRSLKTPGKEPT